MIFMKIYNLETGDFSGIQDSKTSYKEVEKDNDHDISFLYEKQDKEFAKVLRHSLSIEQTEMILDKIVIEHIKRGTKLQISDDTCSETIDALQKMGFAIKYEGLFQLVVRWESKDALSCIKSRYSLRGLSNTDLKKECEYIIGLLKSRFEEIEHVVYEHIIEAKWTITMDNRKETLHYPLVATQIKEYLRTYGMRCDIAACVNSPDITITWHF